MYSYFNLMDELDFFVRAGAEVGSVGVSECGNLIPYIRVGERKGKKIIVSGGIHAREYLTTHLVVMQAYYALKAEKIDGSIYFVPTLNPDGALLIEKGASFFGTRGEFLRRINGGSDDFSLWKANINGVDLNLNFPARWGSGKENRFFPSFQNFVGQSPFSESETRAIRDFTLQILPDATVSYHAKGEVLYWFFHQTPSRLKRDFALASKLNRTLNYTMGENRTLSAGGYKDWCVSSLGIPAFTVEIISDEYSHPLPSCALDEEQIRKNIDLPLNLVKFLSESGEKI